MAPMLDPVDIAAASMSSRTVHSWCVSGNGLLIVPIVEVLCGTGAADRMINCLPAIDKGEVAEITLSDYAGVDMPKELDRFTMCLGWLIGPFVKLRFLDVCSFRGLDCDRFLWMPVLRNLQRHCRDLETLIFYNCPEQVVRVLPAFSNLLELSLSMHRTPDCSAALLLERLSNCSTSLHRLHLLRLELDCGTEDCTCSLQKCMAAFPLRHVSIIDDAYVDTDTLSRTLSQIKWPSRLCMLSLSAAFSGEELCAVAEQVCLSHAAGLFLQSSILGSRSNQLTAADVQQFLHTLQRSWLVEFYWDPPKKLPATTLECVRDGLYYLVDSIYSLRRVSIGVIGDQLAMKDLRYVTWKWGVQLCTSNEHTTKYPACVGCCG